MKLKLTLLTFCLFGIGLFSHAQGKKTPPEIVKDGDDPIPVTVTTKKKYPKPHVLPQYDKNGKLLPAPPPPPPAIDRKGPKKEQVRFAPPKIVKDGETAPPPPPKIDTKHFKAPKDAPRDKDGNLVPPPPPIDRKGSKKGQVHFAPPKVVKDKPPVNPQTPPPADERS